MSDSVRELRDALLKAEGIINNVIDSLYEEFPDFTYSMSLDEHKILGRHRKVKLEPRLIDRSGVGYSR